MQLTTIYLVQRHSDYSLADCTMASPMIFDEVHVYVHVLHSLPRGLQ